MTRRMLLLLVGVGLASSACGRLGLGLPACETPPTNPSPATVLVLQAVPTADYAPCINSLKLGWDEVAFGVESGKAELQFGREFASFLDVRLTESCDIGDAIAVESGMDDVARFDDIRAVGTGIGVTLIPTGERPRIHALRLANDLEGVRIEGRPITFTVDENVDFEVRTRVNEALFTDDYVWIINDLDVEEETLEMRRTADGEGARGLSIGEALDRIEDQTPEVSYRGQWFFLFEGGCITYDFDAEGTVAATVAQDATESIGFYPNEELRRVGRSYGYNLVDD